MRPSSVQSILLKRWKFRTKISISLYFQLPGTNGVPPSLKPQLPCDMLSPNDRSSALRRCLVTVIVVW